MIDIQLFNEAKIALDVILSLRQNEINDEAVLKKLHNVNLALQSNLHVKDDRLISETKILEFPSVFIKIFYAAENARSNNSGTLSTDHTQEILSEALATLALASAGIERFHESFYETHLVMYLLVLLARQFPTDGVQGQRKKHLDLNDACICIKIIINVLSNDPRIGRQLYLYKCKEVIEKYFTCNFLDISLEAYALCSHLANKQYESELKIPTTVLQTLLENLLNALKGQPIRTIASGLLRRLQKMILCSEHVSEQIWSLGNNKVLDLLTIVLNAPEPDGNADSQYFIHTQIRDTVLNAAQICTTFLEKTHAASVCLALLLSENFRRVNAQKILEHANLQAALRLAAEKPNGKLRETARFVLWQLQLHQPISSILATSFNSTFNADSNATERLQLRRPSATPRTINRSSNYAMQNEGVAIRQFYTASLPNNPSSDMPSASTPIFPAIAANRRTVMISYSSNYKPQLVRRINNSLLLANIASWIHGGNTDGELRSADVNRAIEESTAVIICFSSAYYNDDHCHAESDYARLLQKPLILLRMENFEPVGWLGNLIGEKAYHDFSSNDLDYQDGNNFDTKMQSFITDLQTTVFNRSR